MDMSGEVEIAADRATVWAALNDEATLAASILGCETVERTSDTEFTAVVVQKVGPVKARFTGEVTLSDIVEGESYTITGKGKGGAAGGASGGAKVRLEEADGGTLLVYEAEAKVTGKIAQLGGRLINGFARKMADQFFANLKEQIEGPAGEETDAAEDGETIGAQVDAAIETVKETASKAADKAEEASRGAAGAVANGAGKLKDSIEKAEPEKKGFWRRLIGG